MSEKMPVERAAEIFDPKHRERHESLSAAEEACPNCGSSDYLYGYFDKPNKCCGNCGQAILWED